MSKAIRMTTDQKTFLIETDDSVEIPAALQPPPNLRLDGVPEGMQPVVDAANVLRQFSEVRDLIVVCCNGLFESISSLRNPEKVAVEFGIKLAGQAGVPMLTQASGEANFKVSIEWKKDSTQ
jgi:hypothetical protein